jgi:hypothetical protein
MSNFDDMKNEQIVNCDINITELENMIKLIKNYKSKLQTLQKEDDNCDDISAELQKIIKQNISKQYLIFHLHEEIKKYFNCICSEYIHGEHSYISCNAINVYVLFKQISKTIEECTDKSITTLHISFDESSVVGGDWQKEDSDEFNKYIIPLASSNNLFLVLDLKNVSTDIYDIVKLSKNNNLEIIICDQDIITLKQKAMLKTIPNIKICKSDHEWEWPKFNS